MLCSKAVEKGMTCKIREAISLKIAIEDSKTWYIAMAKRLKTVNQRRGVSKTKSLWCNLV